MSFLRLSGRPGGSRHAVETGFASETGSWAEMSAIGHTFHVPPVPDPVSDRLRAALAAGPRLRLAVLFGSRATGRARQGSDFDIGIVPVDPDLSLHDELTLASALSEAVGAEVDVVRLDGDAPQLGAEVARAGVCLLEEAPGVFAAYRADAISLWLDFEETIAPHRAHFLRKLAARGR
jgi:predicted nucleotidyltransferase